MKLTPEKDGILLGRRLEFFHHNTMPEWGYAADQTDDNWAGVVSAFVDGWATEYALANG